MAGQLKMILHGFENLPEIELPEGYGLRTYMPGDEAAWAEIMNTGIGKWDAREVRKELTDKEQFLPERLFFITHDGKPVASACAWVLQPGESEHGYLHMVCVLPEERGKQLGYLVTLAVLHYFRDHGFKDVILNTDDTRIPALKSYLRLGFEPVYEDDVHRARWQNVYDIIASQK